MKIFLFLVVYFVLSAAFCFWIGQLIKSNEKKSEKCRKNLTKKKFPCYEIWRPNIPAHGCDVQCKECAEKEKELKNLNNNLNI